MKITCPSCGANYNVDDSRIPANGMTMRCPKCSHSFRVTAQGAGSVDAGSTQKAGAGTLLNGGGHSIKGERFYVKRPTGKVFGPFDASAVEMMLKSGKLSSEAEVSSDKAMWKPLSNIPMFSKYAKSGPIPSFGGADPKATMMGGWQKQNEPGVPNLPAAKPADLPVSSGGLPASKGTDLPVSAGAGLPISAGAGLPVSAGAGLPVSAGQGLPVSAGAGLPVSAGQGLPVSAGQGLPAPKVGAGLPTPKVGLPTPKGVPGLPTAKPASVPTNLGLPKPVGLPKSGPPAIPIPKSPPAMPDAIPMPDSGGDLFGGASAGEDDLFGASPSTGDDLFGGPPSPAIEDGADLFGGNGDDDDLFGRPDDDDDLFGSAAEPTQKQHTVSADDDLFGAPSSSAPALDEDDLFGGGDDDDLFIERDTPKTSDDDFLGGDAGFSFLDDSPPPEDDDWGDDMFGDESSVVSNAPSPSHQAVNVEASADAWGDDLLDRPSPRKPKEQIYDDHDPFRPMSDGIREPEPEPDSSAQDVVVDDKGRGKMMFIAAPVLVILLAGVGYGVYSAFFAAGPEVAKKSVLPVGPVGVDLTLVQPDNYSDYVSLIDKALQGKVSGEDAAELLVVESLFLSRYDDDRIRKEATARSAKYQDASGGMEALGRGAFEAQAGNADAARAYLEPLLGGTSDEVFFANLLMGIGDVRAMEKEVAAGNLTLEVKKKEVAAVVAAADAGADTSDAGAEIVTADMGSDADMGAALAAVPSTNNPLLTRAKLALNAASDANANSPLPPYWLGRLALLSKDLDEAIVQFANASKRSPSHVASKLALGRLYYDRGDLNESSDYLEKLTGELAATASVDERADAHHYVGLVHAARRQSDPAIQNFTQALQLDPSRTSTLRALALEYEGAKKYKEALNFFKTNKNLGQNEPEVVLGIVRSHIGLEQWNDAIQQLEAAQKTFPEDARFPFYLGKLNSERGDFLQAQKSFQRAAKINPELLTAHTALAQLAWRMDKDIQNGEGHIANVMKFPNLIDDEVSVEVAKYYHMSGRLDLAEDWYRSALKANPNSWPARLALSKLLLEEKKNVEAQGLLEKARAEGVQDIRLAAYLADAYRQSGDYDRAIDEINKVIEQFPKNDEYIYIRGRIQFDRGSFETARKDFSHAYDLNPRFYDAYFYVGRTAYEMGDAQSALKIFRHVLDYQPQRGEFRYYMARALEDAGRTSQALDEYRKATAVDKDFGKENPVVFIYRGRLLTRLGYAKEGRADLAYALDLAPDLTVALLAMGDSEYLSKNYAEAAGHYTKALAAEPNHPEPQYRLGMALIYSGKQRAGAQRLQLAAKYGYKDPEIYQTLGYLYKELGQRSLALEAFQKYLRATKDADLPVSTRRELLNQIKSLGG